MSDLPVDPPVIRFQRKFNRKFGLCGAELAKTTTDWCRVTCSTCLWRIKSATQREITQQPEVSVA